MQKDQNKEEGGGGECCRAHLHHAPSYEQILKLQKHSFYSSNTSGEDIVDY